MGAGDSRLQQGHVLSFRSRATGHYLRAHGNGALDANGAGGGTPCHFRVYSAGPGAFRFESVAFPGRYLRVDAGVSSDCNGGVGPWTILRIEHHENTTVSVSSAQNPRFYVGFFENGAMKTGAGNGRHGRFDLEYAHGGPPPAVVHTPVVMHQPPAAVHVAPYAGPGYAMPAASVTVHHQPAPVVHHHQPAVVVHHQKPGRFANGRRLYLRSLASGRTVRVMHNGAIDGCGGMGPWAQFEVVRCGKFVKFRCVNQPTRYLRISQHGQLDTGGGGKWCEFRRHRLSVNPPTFAFESVHVPGRHLAIMNNGTVKDPNSTAGRGRFTHFTVEMC